MQLDETSVVVIPSELDRVTVLNTETGMKSTLRLPRGMTEVMPIFSSEVGALVLKGPEVRQIVAFDFQRRKWFPQDLKEPTTEASPIVGPQQVVYQLGRFIYVFSLQARKWGVLELKQDPGTGNSFLGTGSLRNGKIMIPEDDLIHLYNPKAGEWTRIDSKDDK